MLSPFSYAAIRYYYFSPAIFFDDSPLFLLDFFRLRFLSSSHFFRAIFDFAFISSIFIFLSRLIFFILFAAAYFSDAYAMPIFAAIAADCF